MGAGSAFEASVSSATQKTASSTMAELNSPSTPQRPPVLVLKIGSSSIVDEETGFLALSRLSMLVEHICSLRRTGYRVVLVTSGAVGVGMRRLGMAAPPRDTVQKQAAAAVGQGRLMSIYDDLFSQLNTAIAQVLLTRNDMGDRGHFLNKCKTLRELLAMDVVPIVNENDTVSAAEIRFGDNDTLSALVAGMVDAQWLFLLTDVDCLYTSNPRTNPDARPIRVVEDLDAIRQQVDVAGTGTSMGTGGMQTKLIAAELTTAAGCHAAIVKSDRPEYILRIIAGEPLGTVFRAKPKPLGDRKWWIKHSLHISGKLWIDDGALAAIQKWTSLFAAGIQRVEGTFVSQNAVTVVSVTTGKEIARGLVNYTSAEIDRIKGCKSSEFEALLGYIDSDCVIHRQNLVLL
jgi:glutamate 5-kinase